MKLNSDACSAVVTFEESEAVDLILSRGNQLEILKVTATVQPVFESDESNDPFNQSDSKMESIHDVEQWERTIKATLSDIPRSKDGFVLYFEDPEISQGDFDETSFLLDGLNKQLYVTFNTKQAAVATCGFEHSRDSNIVKVEMAKEEDSNTYSKFLFVHGYCCDTEDKQELLKDHIEGRTGFGVIDILQGDDPMSVIMVFDPEACDDISEATWQCLEGPEGVNLITAPVMKTKSIRVTGLSQQITDATLKRYLTSSKYSGGGPLGSFERINDSEAIASFQEEKAYENILIKEEHTLEKICLTVFPHYPCLSTEARVGGANVKPSKRSHQGRPSTQSKALSAVPGLHFHPAPLCLKSNVQYVGKAFHGFIKLSELAYGPLKENYDILCEVAKNSYCKCELTFDGKFTWLKLSLDSSDKLTSSKMKDMLSISVDGMKRCLNGFHFCKSRINESHSCELQQLFGERKRQDVRLKKAEIFFDHHKNEIAIFSEEDPQWIIKKLNDTYQSLLADMGPINMGGNPKYAMKPVRKTSMGMVGERQMSGAGGPASDQSWPMSSRFADMSYGPTQYIGEKSVPHHTCSEDGNENKFTNKEDLEEDEEELPQQTVDLDFPQLMLLKKTNICTNLEENYKPLKVILDFNKQQVILKGQEQNLNSAMLEFLLKTRGFKNMSISSFSQNQLKFLKKQSVCDKINSVLDEKGYEVFFQCQENSALVHGNKEIDIAEVKELVQSQVIEEELKIDKDTAFLFESEKGRGFLSEIYDGNDGIKVIANVTLGSQLDHLQVIVLADQRDLISKQIQDFIKNNKLHTKQIPFSHGKWKFTKKFLKNELEKIQDSLTKQGAKLTEAQDCLVLKGLIDSVTQGEKELSAIRDKIQSQEKTLQYFGIKEYLQEAEGDQWMKSVEESQSCVMTLKHRIDSKPVKVPGPVKPPTPIAEILMNDCSVFVMQGDITSLLTDVIVNPVDSSLQCMGALGRALLARGGQSIQTELNTSGGDRTSGSVIETSAGLQQQHKAIVDVVCPVSGTSTAANELEEAIVQCLQHVASKGFESVAFPILGIGRTFKFTSLVACSTMVRTLDTFLSIRDTAKPSKIFFCDTKKEHLTQLQDRFESVQGCAVNKLNAPEETSRDSTHGQRSRSSPVPPPKPHHFKPPRKDFKKIKVSIEKGEITKQKTDVIAVTTDKSLDLRNGGIAKAVLRYGGEALQQELHDSYDDGIKLGEFAVSSGGMLQCQYVFYVALSHWRSGNENELSKLVYKMLEAADEKQASSVSFPAFGTGKLGYPIDTAATVMIDAISNYARKNSNTSVKTVILIVFPTDEDVLKAFKQALSGETGRDQERRGTSGSPRDHNLTRPTQAVSSTAEIVFYSDNSLKIQSAVRALDDALRKTFKEDKDHDKGIKRLQKYQIRKLEDEGLQHRVQVFVKQEEGIVIMKGFKTEGLYSVHKCLTSMLKNLMEEDQRSIQRTLELAKVWQYQQEEKWKNFDPSLNVEIEKEYKGKSGRGHCDITDNRGRKYRIEFKEMQEFQLDDSGSKRGNGCRVRRYDRTRAEIELPKKWEHMKSDGNLKLVTLKPGSEEYKAVEQGFSSTGGRGPIKKIERVQNRSLYLQYKAKKLEIDCRNPKGHKNETRLYHGSDPHGISAIAENGFNRNYRGKNATAHGNGVYFALNAQLSCKYSCADANGDNKMFQARVLTGESCPTSKGMNFLPNKPNSNTPYDSGTASGMYVIYHDTQAYPEYLITF